MSVTFEAIFGVFRRCKDSLPIVAKIARAHDIFGTSMDRSVHFDPAPGGSSPPDLSTHGRIHASGFA
tara:strand:- start:849 stop:1049 length:201 start_codon:yes stop_codon:yes gene_type:complete